MIDTTNFVVSLNLLISTSKCINLFALAFCSTTLLRSRTAPIDLRYPAGSTAGSILRGIGTEGIFGVILTGVVGERNDEDELTEFISTKLVFRDSPVVELDFREKSPMMASFEGKNGGVRLSDSSYQG
jgi:hypothetical protein